MKKTLAILLATTIAASANMTGSMTGFFIGAGVGGRETTAKYTDVTNNAPQGTNLTLQSFTPISSHNGRTMFGGRIEAGYGRTFSGCGWFGISAYATALSTKIALHTSVPASTATGNSLFLKSKLKNKYNFGVEFKLGYHFTKNTVGFVGIAAEAAKYKIEWVSNSGTSSSIGISTINNAFGTRYSTSKTKLYAKPVIGFRTTGIAGNRNLFVELKYGFGLANRITLNVPATASDSGYNNLATGGRNVSVTPRHHEVFVTVGWMF